MKKKNVMDAKLYNLQHNSNSKRVESSLSMSKGDGTVSITSRNYTSESEALQGNEPEPLIFDSFYSPYCVVVDWFQAKIISAYLFDLFTTIDLGIRNCDRDELQIGDHITLKLTRWNSGKAKSTGHFSRMYDVYVGDDESAFMQLLALPRDEGKGRLLDKSVCEIRVYNHEFYRQYDGGGWASKLRFILSEFEAEMKNVARLDIALDGKNLLDIYERFHYCKDVAAMGRKKKNRMCNFDENGELVELREKSETLQEGSDFSGFYWGARHGDKCLNGYRKGDVVVRENKPYVSQFWSENGLNPGNIQRLELRLKSENIRTIPDFAPIEVAVKKDSIEGERTEIIKIPFDTDAICLLDDPKYLAGILESQFRGWFEFVPVTGDSNKSRRERIKFIDFERLKAVKMERLSITRKPNELHAMKRTAKGMLKAAENPRIVRRVKEKTPEMFSETKLGSDVDAKVEKAISEHIAKSYHYKLPANALEGITDELAPIFASAFADKLELSEVRKMIRGMAYEIAEHCEFAPWLRKHDPSVCRVTENEIKQPWGEVLAEDFEVAAI